MPLVGMDQACARSVRMKACQTGGELEEREVRWANMRGLAEEGERLGQSALAARDAAISRQGGF